MIPKYIEDALKVQAGAWSAFERLAPSCKREYVTWIDSAKREETKQKRLREAVGMITGGKKFGTR